MRSPENHLVTADLPAPAAPSRLRPSLPVVGRWLWWVLLSGLSVTATRADPRQPFVDLSGDCGADRVGASVAALPAGRWQGTVDFIGARIDFSLDVGDGGGVANSLRLKTAQRTVVVAGVTRENDHVVIPIDERSGERMVGRLRGDTLIGHYFVGDGEKSAALSFPFHAKLQARTDAVAATQLNGLTGEWQFAFTPAVGSHGVVRALMGQGAGKLYVVWRNPDGSKRYLMGERQGDRFVLKEIASGAELVFGRVDPLTDTLRGEIVEASSRVAFSATRRVPERPRYAAQLP